MTVYKQKQHKSVLIAKQVIFCVIM